MSVFPGSIDSDATLYVARDNIQTKIVADMSAVSTVAIVSDSTGWVANMIATVDSEQMLVVSVAGSAITVTRAFAGTIAAAHSAGKNFSNFVDAAYQVASKQAIINIETALGANLVNISTVGPLVSRASFVFTPQTPGGSLVIGANTITMTPVPAGVNGTDTSHYLYISGGTGTAEAALIIGGTGVAGNASGQIIIQCANTHSGAWTIQSASAGILEARVSIGGVGSVLFGKANVNIYCRMLFPTTFSLIGEGTAASIMNCVAAANPAIAIADNLGTADGQGQSVHSGYQLIGPGSQNGLWIGGDPSAVWAPSAWTGSYMRIENVLVRNFSNALVYWRGNFLDFYSSVFGGISRALYFPAGSGGEHQPLEFTNCVLTVPTGPCFQMDDSGFSTNMVQFYGGQISGTVTGNDVFLETWGTHFEPNEQGAALVSITGDQAKVKVHGGLLAVHGANPSTIASMFNFNGVGDYELLIEDTQVQADVGVTVTNFVSFTTTLKGGLVIANNRFASAGVFSNLYSISKTTLDANVVLYVNQLMSQANTGIAAGATVTFAKANYPVIQRATIFGGTVGGSGITAVAGLTAYCSGTLVTTSAQTFTAGASIGNTITTVANVPYNFQFDGTQIFIK